MAPEPIGAVPCRGAGVGRCAAPRLAGVEVPGRELGAAIVDLGTLRPSQTSRRTSASAAQWFST